MIIFADEEDEENGDNDPDSEGLLTNAFMNDEIIMEDYDRPYIIPAFIRLVAINSTLKLMHV